MTSKLRLVNITYNQGLTPVEKELSQLSSGIGGWAVQGCTLEIIGPVLSLRSFE